MQPQVPDIPVQAVPPVQTLPAQPDNRFLLIFNIILFILVVAIGAGILYYKSTAGRRQAILPVSPTAAPLSPSPSPQPTKEVEEPETALSGTVAGAHDAFGFSLLRSLNNGKDNIVISPVSIALALSMTYNGSAGQTQTAMAKTLNIKDISVKDMNKQSLEALSDLTQTNGDFQLTVANSIWARKGVSFKQEFLDTNKTYFKAGVDFLDFADLEAASAINRWVSKETGSKITSIVRPPLPTNAVMYLINAVYFKAAWSDQFNKSLTVDKPFNPAGLPAVNIPTMEQTRSFDYLENDLFQAAVLPYGTTQRMRMIIFLPKGSPDGLLTQLTLANWLDWTAAMKPRSGTLLLPRFRVEYKKSLEDPLSQMGMKVAFTAGADFSLMAPKEANIYIDDVVHKTYIDVNEEGTEAAAVTAVIPVTGGGMPDPEPPFRMEVNKPFFFAIEDNDTKELLFIGLINNPKK